MDDLSLPAVLDLAAERLREGRAGPLRADPDAAADPVARAVLLLLQDRQIRGEHRLRILADLAARRELLLETRDPRLVDLIFWSEHVERLTGALKRKRIGAFHFSRALEATCRRCGFDLLPAMGRLEELGRAWAERDYAAAYRMLQPTS